MKHIRYVLFALKQKITDCITASPLYETGDYIGVCPISLMGSSSPSRFCWEVGVKYYCCTDSTTDPKLLAKPYSLKEINNLLTGFSAEYQNDGSVTSFISVNPKLCKHSNCHRGLQDIIDNIREIIPIASIPYEINDP